MGLPGRARPRLATWGSTFSEGATQHGGAAAGVVDRFSVFWMVGKGSARPPAAVRDPWTLPEMRDYPPFKRVADFQNQTFAFGDVTAKGL